MFLNAACNRKISPQLLSAGQSKSKRLAAIPRHQVRIIAGQWRGRKLPVPDVEGLRPSKDIIRETLFNWLQPLLPGSCCLDAFAGAGALGFEAASRDAAKVIMLDKSRLAVDSLEKIKAGFHAQQVDVQLTDAMVYLQNSREIFDIVFLDPPFDGGLLEPACRLLAGSRCLHAGSRIYLEAARREGLPQLPDGWTLLREKHSGDVVYGLAGIGL
jgi:16S rRNA (guanine966-N2)-methyltransferase